MGTIHQDILRAFRSLGTWYTAGELSRRTDRPREQVEAHLKKLVKKGLVSKNKVRFTSTNEVKIGYRLTEEEWHKFQSSQSIHQDILRAFRGLETSYTAGELSRRTDRPREQVKDYVKKLVKKGLVSKNKVRFKSTNEVKIGYRLTDKGWNESKAVVFHAYERSQYGLPTNRPIANK